MDRPSLEARFQKIAAMHRALGDEIAVLRAALFQEPAPKPSVTTDLTPSDPLAAARAEILDGYQIEAGMNVNDLLHTLVLRLLQGDANGVKDRSLPAARLIACHMIEATGLRASPRWGGARLAKLFTRQVPFTPVRSIRRLPR